MLLPGDVQIWGSEVEAQEIVPLCFFGALGMGAAPGAVHRRGSNKQQVVSQGTRALSAPP